MRAARPDVNRDLELHRTTGLLLDDHGTGSNFYTCDESADFDFNEITAAEFTVDCEIKQRAISHAPSRSRKKRIAQIWRCFSGFLTPTLRPAFHAERPSAVGSYCAIPI